MQCGNYLLIGHISLTILTKSHTGVGGLFDGLVESSVKGPLLEVMVMS